MVNENFFPVSTLWETTLCGIRCFTIMPAYDYLVIGQGIAGSMLSYFLLKKGSKVLVADQFQPSSASNVAAGIVNPLTGRRLVKTWMAGAVFPFADCTYIELEKILNEDFWYRMNIAKIISTPGENDFLNRRKVSADYLDLISFPKDSELYGFKQPVAFEINGSGYLDMAKLIREYRKMLFEKDILVGVPFHNEEMVVDDERIFWKGYSFKRVIFCDGYKSTENPLFSWVPFVPAKGEVLTIHSTELNIDKIVMKDIFILPLGNGYYKVGATYQWDQLDGNPTLEGRNQLTQKLDAMLDCSYTIINHVGGIRPVVKDRKPCLGIHPVYKCIGIFNGLGTKGASLAPYFASHFADYLEENKPLNKETDVARFYKYFKG